MSAELSVEETRWIRSPRVASVADESAGGDVPERLVLLNVDSRVPLVVEGTGLEIWELTENSRSVADMVRILVDRYGEGHATDIEDQVNAFLGNLASAGLVQKTQS
ncbi:MULTISPECIES: PqqD family protein [Arthrobacter]|uniref:PqqD family protein n=2 Tax=Arthrobacter TaxID=1663 RepID=A0ABU9KMD2_9MICC|nr:PqqD family protein [Arthrobacter sp. YJM1]MDP5227731.1 PqqD family protein [Arthrobacter sp. YJM1]